MGGAKLAIVITAQLLPIGRSPRSLSGETVPTGHAVCRMSFRSTQEDVIETINDDPGNWVRDLFGRTMVEGMNAGEPHDPTCRRLENLRRWPTSGSNDLCFVRFSKASRSQLQGYRGSENEVGPAGRCMHCQRELSACRWAVGTSTAFQN